MKPVLHSSTNSIGADAIASLVRRMRMLASDFGPRRELGQESALLSISGGEPSSLIFARHSPIFFGTAARSRFVLTETDKRRLEPKEDCHE